MNPHIAVIVLNWNGWQDTLQCLDSLALQSYPNTSIIVVDNASTDGSRERIVKWADDGENQWVHRQFIIDDHAPATLNLDVLRNGDFVYIQSDVNGGFASGNNLGIWLALEHQAIYVWILNNDTEVHPLALDALVNCAEKDPAIGMCGSVLIYHDSRNQIQACGGANFNYLKATGTQIGHGLDPQNVKWDEVISTPLTYIAGASLLARSKMILDIGAFEEKYFLYFEEIDWAERARNWKKAVAKDSIVFHKEGASIGTASRGRRSALSQYYLNRNLIIFYAQFHKALLPIAIARVMRELLWQIKMQDRQLLAVTWHALIDGVLMREGRIDLDRP